jgi:hypothetical protein
LIQADADFLSGFPTCANRLLDVFQVEVLTADFPGFTTRRFDSNEEAAGITVRDHRADPCSWNPEYLPCHG